MRNLKTGLVLIVLMGLAASMVGCGGDDANPAAVANDTLTLDNSTAEDFSLQALDVVNGMVSEVPDIASADFGAWALGKSALTKTNSDSVTWDANQSAWVFNYEGPLFAVEAPSYWNISLDLWVQYRNSLGPMQFPVGATTMEVQYGSGMDMHFVEGATTSDVAYQMNTALTVSYLGESGNYGVVGTGSTMVDMNQTGDQQMQSGHFAMDWSLDVTVSDLGCPTGTATVNAQQYQMVANYDGLGNVTWTLTGPNYQASGTESMGCGLPLH